MSRQTAMKAKDWISQFPLWMVSIILITGSVGCTTVFPTFENSNQFFMERTVDQIEVGNKLKQKLPAGSTVAVRSIEKDFTSDRPIVALIEDQMIKSLSENGYKVMERDENSVFHLSRERMTNGNFSVILRKEDKLPVPAETRVGVLSIGVVNEKDDKKEKSEDEYFKVIPTKLKPADYLLSYRIQELGIVYQRIPNNDEEKKRLGMIRVHIRVQDTNTGAIVYADNLQGELQDIIPSALVRQLRNFRYSPFPHTYPEQPGGQDRDIREYSGEEDRGYFVAIGFPQLGGGATMPPAMLEFGYDFRGTGRVGIEMFNGSEKSTDARIGKPDLNRSTTLITYAYPMMNLGYNFVKFVPAFGLGNMTVDVVEHKKVGGVSTIEVKEKTGIGFKGSAGVEGYLFWNLAIRGFWDLNIGPGALDGMFQQLGVKVIYRW
ncbi:MAG: hypothetical protein HQM12_08985 [SAR324 cluster bacterium]|nr:hypothetical protein [SAR324 cluster bacterium]